MLFAPWGEDGEEFYHGLSATGTGVAVGWFFGGGGDGADEQWAAGVEGDAFAFEFGGGVAVAVVADGS